MSLLNYNRNTDADWEHIAQRNPYYGVLTNNRFLNMNLNNDTKVEFFESGKRDIAHLAGLWNDFDGHKLNATLDFGSGVGRLTIPMAAYSKQTFGVEISDSMIAEFKNNLKQFNIKNAQIYKTIDDLLLSNPAKMFDWINSYIVFQHIPPSKGYILLEKLMKILKVGGYFSLHFKIFNVKETKVGTVYQQTDFNTQTALYANHSEALGEMQMYDYDINKIYYLFLKYGVGDFKCITRAMGDNFTVLLIGCRNNFTLLPPIAKHAFLKCAEEWSQAITEMQGFSYNESWGTWTESLEALITFYLLDEMCGKDLVMDIVLKAFLDKRGEQNFKICAGNEIIAEYTTRDDSVTEYCIHIPSDIIMRDYPYLTVKFVIKNPTSPYQYKQSGDTRKLGIGIMRLLIKKS